MKIDTIKNPKILNDFLEYLKIMKYSDETRKAYNSDLQTFFNFIIEYMNLKIEFKQVSLFVVVQIKTSDVIAFLSYLSFSKDNNPYTRQRRLSAIRTFYKWLLVTKSDKISFNPTDEIDNIIKKTERLPKFLNLKQAKQLQNIFTLQNSKYPIRNNAIISLFLSSGIRISELTQIDVKDINWNNNSIRIIGKGNKERIVYFNIFCKEKLLKYIEYRKRKEKVSHIEGALFLNRSNKRIGLDGVEDVCKKAYKLLGIEEKGYSTHTLRHSAATILYQHVNDILLIKQFLGHESITSTEIYTHLHNMNVRNATNKNPLSNYKTEKEGKRKE